VRAALSTPSQIERARDNLPLILLLLVVGLVFISRGQSWAERLALRMMRGKRKASSELGAFVVSLGQIALPLIGAVSILLAIGSTELFGPRGEIVIFAFVPMILMIFAARWLGSRVYPKVEDARTPLGSVPETRKRARAICTMLGVVLAFSYLINLLGQFERFSRETFAVLQFPLLVIAAFGLLAIARGLLNHKSEHTGQEGEQAFRGQFLSFLGRTVQIAAIFGVVLAAAGYTLAAELLIYATLLTLAWLAAIAILQDVIRNLYAWLIPGDDARESLVPTLAGFLLLLVSLPLLPLFWGARVTDLTELWSRARAGVDIGGTTVSPTAFFTLIVVFLIGYFVTRGLQGMLRSSVLPKTRLEKGAQTALVSGLGYVGMFLAALIAVTSAGIDLSNIALVAGALSVGIGFGLQNIVSNFVSGIILLIERPISEGDWIEVGGQHGYVRKVSVRSTRIETFDRTDVIVPNADLVSGAVTNYTRGNTVGRAIVQVGVAYGTDTRRVEKILREIAEAHPLVLANPAPSIVFAGFGASSLDFEIRAILRDVNFMLSVKTEMHHQIAERFVAENIEIPFAQTDLWLRNPEALRGGQGENS
jgi:small-conductance mechanosensitive channel